VPADASSVVLNVTVTDPTSVGFLTIFPSGGARPASSSLNFSAGQSVPNLVIAKVGSAGHISIYSFGGTVQVVLDVTGYFVPSGGGRLYTFPPYRTFDTRINARFNGTVAPVGPNQTFPLSLLGIGPTSTSHLSAILLNVTAANSTAGGYVTVWPTGDAFPSTSSLNFRPNQTAANAVIVKLGTSSDGQGNPTAGLSFYNATGSTDLIIDILGYFDDGSTPVGLTGTPLVFRALDQPTRVYDSRDSTPLSTKESRAVRVTGANTAGAAPWVAVLNVVATQTTAPSYLTLWPSSVPRPTASTLNWQPGDTVANFAGVAVPAAGAAAGLLGVYNEAGQADVVIDATGYFYPQT
jgi:hypothetical protein